MRKVVGKVIHRLLEGPLQPIRDRIRKRTRAEDLTELVDLLRPIDPGIDLIRVGGDSDGGYLIPDDLTGIAHCFSPGVADSSSFELDCMDRGIPSFLADYSVDEPPIELPNITFTKRFLGAFNN